MTQIKTPQPVFGTTAGALQEKKKLRRHLGAAGDGRADLAGLRCHLVRCRGEPNDNLAALSFSHEPLQYELSQIVPLAVIVLVGLAFYFLGGKTRREPGISLEGSDPAP